jgi:hypothetical protein
MPQFKIFLNSSKGTQCDPQPGLNNCQHKSSCSSNLHKRKALNCVLNNSLQLPMSNKLLHKECIQESMIEDPHD